MQTPIRCLKRSTRQCWLRPSLRRTACTMSRARTWEALDGQTRMAVSTVDLKVVKGGCAYGSAQSPEGAPALVRYRVDEQ